MGLIFTELARYSFTRPNIDPIDPAVWATILPNPDDAAPFEDLAVVGNQCVCPTSLSNANGGGAEFNGVVLPPDQYVEIVITKLKNNAFLGIGLRSDVTSFIGYEISMNDTGALDTPIALNMGNVGPDGGPSGGDMAETTITLHTGDTLRFAAIGGLFIAYINGAEVLRATESPLEFDSGTTFLEFQNFVANDDVEIASYAVGSVTQTPDLLGDERVNVEWTKAAPVRAAAPAIRQATPVFVHPVPRRSIFK